MSLLLSIEFFIAGRCYVGKTWITFLRSTLVTFLILMAQRSAVSTMQETSFQLILMIAAIGPALSITHARPV